MRHRIIQFEGKRYSIKLDDRVWESLETLAAEADMRLNELVAKVAREVSDGANVTGALRLYCLDQALIRIQRLEGEIRTLSSMSQGVPVTVFAEACPAPCLLVSRTHHIRYANDAAQRWMGSDGATLTGRNILHYFQIRSVPSLSEVIERFAQGARTVVAARLIHVRPGKVVMTKATISPAVVVPAGEDLAYFLMIDDR